MNNSDLAFVLNGMSGIDNIDAFLIKKFLGENITLHSFVMNPNYNHRQCKQAIFALLHNGIDPNILDENGLNFIELALRNGFDDYFIYSILEEAIKYNLRLRGLDDLYLSTSIDIDRNAKEDLEKYFDMIVHYEFNHYKELLAFSKVHNDNIKKTSLKRIFF